MNSCARTSSAVNARFALRQKKYEVLNTANYRQLAQTSGQGHKCAHRKLSHPRGAVGGEGNDKGTLSAEHHRKPDTETREQARRINNLELGALTTGWRFESSPVHQSSRFVLYFQLTNSCRASSSFPCGGTEGNNKAAT
jgi:hypothetical protein